MTRYLLHVEKLPPVGKDSRYGEWPFVYSLYSWNKNEYAFRLFAEATSTDVYAEKSSVLLRDADAWARSVLFDVVYGAVKVEVRAWDQTRNLNDVEWVLTHSPDGQYSFRYPTFGKEHRVTWESDDWGVFAFVSYRAPYSDWSNKEYSVSFVDVVDPPATCVEKDDMSQVLLRTGTIVPYALKNGLTAYVHEGPVPIDYEYEYSPEVLCAVSLTGKTKISVQFGQDKRVLGAISKERGIDHSLYDTIAVGITETVVVP